MNLRLKKAVWRFACTKRKANNHEMTLQLETGRRDARTGSSATTPGLKGRDPHFFYIGSALPSFQWLQVAWALTRNLETAKASQLSISRTTFFRPCCAIPSCSGLCKQARIGHGSASSLALVPGFGPELHVVLHVHDTANPSAASVTTLAAFPQKMARCRSLRSRRQRQGAIAAVTAA